MRFGYISTNSATGIRPDVVARELEDRGFDSLWVPEHSHIPTSRESPYPLGGELPEGYLHMMAPFVSLTAAATATKSLIVATGVCLVLEHDLLDLACTTATLDVLSGGRRAAAGLLAASRLRSGSGRTDPPDDPLTKLKSQK